MALQYLDSMTIDHAGGDTRTLMLCQGDLSQLSPADAVDYIAISAFPGDYTPTPGSLIGALSQAGLSVEQQSTNKAANYEPTMPCWVSQDVSAANLNFRRFILFEPSDPATNAQFDIFMIYQALSCATANNATSIALPLVCTGSGGANFAVVLSQLFFMGARAASCAAWPLSTIKLVAYSPGQAATAAAQFAAMKAGYQNPPLSAASYPLLAGKTRVEAERLDLPPNMTQRQYNAIRAYTGNIYSGVNTAMRKHDYSANDYNYWLPTIEAISSGLGSLPDYVALSLRGANLPPQVISKYVVGATIDHYEFTSSSRDRPFPGNTLLQIQSATGKDVSAISQFPQEDEVLYDYNMTDLVTSISGTQPGYAHVFSSNQVVPNWCGR